MMEIDIDEIAREMLERGVDPVTLADWTGTLVDILEDTFGLETAIRERMEKSL